MSARATLVLSLLFCSRVLAQAPATAPDSESAVHAAVADARGALAANLAANNAGGAAAGGVTTQETNQEAASSTTSAEPDPAEQPENMHSDSQQAVRDAVPVDREALVPATAPPPRRDLEADPLFTPGVVLIGTGSAALLASLFTGLGAHGIYTSLEGDCKNNVCSGDKQHSISSGKALAMVSTVLTGVGIAAAGIGTTLLILAANHDDEPPPPQANFGFAKVQLTGGPTPLGVGAVGSF